MREIKFRAWDRGLKVMQYEEGGDGKFPMDTVELLSLYDLYDVVMQYTGLKDKNGKEIYEGDILAIETTRVAAGGFTNWYRRSSQHDGKCIARVVVEYDPPQYRLNYKNQFNNALTRVRVKEKDKRELIKWELPSFGRIRYEIIGNIYENPELLKDLNSKKEDEHE